MADSKISALPAAAAVAKTDRIAIAEDSGGGLFANKYLTISQIMDLFNKQVKMHPADTYVVSADGLEVTRNADGIGNSVMANRAVNTGRWYFEVTILALGGSQTPTPGLSQLKFPTQVGEAAPTPAFNGSWGLLPSGDKYSGSVTGYGTAMAVNDVIGVAFDMTSATKRMWMSRNGVYPISGNPATNEGPMFSNLAGYVCPAITCAFNARVRFNFAGPFVHSIPAGYLAYNNY